MMKKLFFLFCLIISNLYGYENEKISHLLIGGGIDNISKPKFRTGECYLEYKFSYELHKFRPLLGVMATWKGACYFYGGLDVNMIFYHHFLLLPGFAIGIYHQGNGRDLGYPLEFRSSIALGWQFNNFSRIGVMYYHISNAHLSEYNPGMESLVFFYGFAF